MPVYTRNYYRILGLDAPSYASNKLHVSSADVKRAYRRALLGVHPDKNGTVEYKGVGGGGGEEGGYTVDDVKEAWGVLGDEERRREYEGWFVRRGRGGEGGIEGIGMGRGGVGGGGKEGELDEDFVLGLEVLDLGDFDEVVVGKCACSSTSSPSSSSSIASSGSASASVSSDHEKDREASLGEKGEGEEETETQWTRSCRCGAARGFSISEQDLEKALERGEAEVLVGCEGCSLWVRVGFGVEEGE